MLKNRYFMRLKLCCDLKMLMPTRDECNCLQNCRVVYTVEFHVNCEGIFEVEGKKSFFFVKKK